MSLGRDVAGVTGLRFSLSASDVESRAATLVRDFEQKIDGVAKGASFADTIGALVEATDEIARVSAEVTLPALVGKTSDERAAGAKAKAELSQMFERAHARIDVYDKLKLYTDGSTLAKKHLSLFEANGLNLEPPKRAEMGVLREELVATCTAFEQCINDDCSTIALSEAELEGLPPAFIAALPRDGDNLLVSLKAPTLVPVLQRASVPETRRRAYLASRRRCPANVPRMQRIVQLRRQIAELRGFENHASLALSSRMAGDVTTVESFLDRCASKLKTKRDADLEELTALKGAKLTPQDTAFYGRLLRENLGIDEEALKPYFCAETTVPAAVDFLAETLGSMTARKVDDDALWHESCELYEVRDDKNEIVGHFIVDLFARDGKFGHQMVVPLRPRTQTTTPLVCILGNLGDQSRRLRFAEVETLLHELGHVFHALCGQSKHAITGWAWPMVPWPGGVEMDFLELPSMLAQQWVYSPACLERLSCHAETKASLPAATTAKLAAARHCLAGLNNARFIAMAKYDLAMHTSLADLDVPGMFPALYKEATGMEEEDETHMVSTWYHMAIGYDAAYYGYLWAEVFAIDSYEEFSSSSSGARFKATVMEPAAELSGAEMIKNFLGRPPSDAAYFKRLNGTTN